MGDIDELIDNYRQQLTEIAHKMGQLERAGDILYNKIINERPQKRFSLAVVFCFYVAARCIEHLSMLHFAFKRKRYRDLSGIGFLCFVLYLLGLKNENSERTADHRATCVVIETAEYMATKYFQKNTVLYAVDDITSHNRYLFALYLI